MGKGRQDPGIWRTVCWVPLPLPLSICVVVVSLRPPISLSPIFLSDLFLQWPRFDLPHSTIAVAPLTQTPASLLCSSFLVLPSLSLSLSLSLYIYIYIYVFIYNNNNNNNNNNNFRFCTGGTAFNGVVEELKNFTTRVAHVLPVSDDGGSTAEIVRVLGKFFFLFLMNEFLVFAQQFYFMVSVHFFFLLLGGPAVGDIRSRCLRLSDQSSAEALAVRRLLGHRLPLDARLAKSEWYVLIFLFVLL